jgi:hypothetical protein
MNNGLKKLTCSLLAATAFITVTAQQKAIIKVQKNAAKKEITILANNKIFASFLYPDTLEKPVLFDIHSAGGKVVTRGYPLKPLPGDPNDHPHHIGLWFTFENVNGLDFWNNSFAIPAEKKHAYGWIKTDQIINTTDGEKGILSYHANWVNQQNSVLLEETTKFEFSGTDRQRIIDRITVLKADTTVLFTDAKDGLMGIRLAHALQLPTDKDQYFKDDKGNETIVKGGTDAVAKGNYISSEGKLGDSVWSSRARWCKVFGPMGNDSVSVVIIDHPNNPNYPTYWHARGYGLFSANPLGEKIFTNGKKIKNLSLKKGESVTFRYRLIIDEGDKTIPLSEIDKQADAFAKQRW